MIVNSQGLTDINLYDNVDRSAMMNLMMSYLVMSLEVIYKFQK